MGTKSDALKSFGHFLGGVGLLLIGITMLMKCCHYCPDKSKHRPPEITDKTIKQQNYHMGGNNPHGQSGSRLIKNQTKQLVTKAASKHTPVVLKPVTIKNITIKEVKTAPLVVKPQTIKPKIITVKKVKLKDYKKW